MRELSFDADVNEQLFSEPEKVLSAERLADIRAEEKKLASLTLTLQACMIKDVAFGLPVVGEDDCFGDIVNDIDRCIVRLNHLRG